uniref:Protein FAM204A n=1 Tax=Phallusia mammillata TaxID=59560 RepID=A0A6F9DBV8_9ASCI|nr:protein FAM204A [Phallusia mammillata]
MFKGSLGGEFDLSSTSDESEDEVIVPEKQDLVKSVISKIEKEKDKNLSEESPDLQALSNTSNQAHDFTNSKNIVKPIKVHGTHLIEDPIETPQTSSQNIAETKVQQEKQLQKAIKKGDVNAAVSITDSLCEKDTEEQIKNFVRAQEYLEEKRKKEQIKISRKRKKLAWTFESKKRWETKSNM